MGKYLFLDGGVYQSMDKLVGHHFFLVTSFSLAGGEGTIILGSECHSLHSFHKFGLTVLTSDTTIIH